jgi:hypothetical protein
LGCEVEQREKRDHQGQYASSRQYCRGDGIDRLTLTGMGSEWRNRAMFKIVHAIMTVKKLTVIILAGALVLVASSLALAQGLSPAILIQPGTSVEVGEEVFFSATGTTYPDSAILGKARYEWDFGDGYYLRYDPKVSAITRSGIAATHYFMKPGNFTVTLKVTIWAEFDTSGKPLGSPIATNTATRAIGVTGEAPMAGFEIQRAPFHNRLAQYLYVQIPLAYRGNQTTLRVTLEGAKGSKNVLSSRSNLAAEERVFLDHKPLVPDDYVVIAELLDVNSKRISGGLWRDLFSKRYSGILKVGMDENNAFRLNGELFFPIGSFMTDYSWIKTFVDQAGINIVNTEGYDTTHTAATWGKYLNAASSNNVVAIGPGRGDYAIKKAPAPANRWRFNHNPDRMAEYVRLNKNHAAMFAWIWQDEPNMGGRTEKVYAPTLAAWGYVCHRDDPQHPAFNGFYGYDWSKYFGSAPNIYDYLGSEKLFGGKKWVQDAIAYDVYPLQFRSHPTLNFADLGPYAVSLDILDRIRKSNKDLVPVIPTVMPCNRIVSGITYPISSEQVYLESWMYVIHGAKGIYWFPFFWMDSSGRWDAMKKFTDQIKMLAPVVLQPEPVRAVADDANAPLKRVDTLIREYGGYVYIFAARVTEPEAIERVKYQGIEPESITVNFTVSGITGKAVAEVVDEGRQVSLANGQFKDIFSKNAVHIYKIPSIDTPKNLSVAQ